MSTATKRYKPQLWVRVIEDDELGEVQQFIEHTEDDRWLGWEVYPDLVSDKVEVERNFIPMGYREIKP